MSFLLIYKYGYTNEVIEFLKRTSKYAGLSYNDISFNEAKSLFDEFRKLFNENI